MPGRGNSLVATRLSLACAALALLSLSACKNSGTKGTPSPGRGVPLAGHSCSGLNLELRDGSSWQVQPVGQGKVLHWLPDDPILVQRITHPVFPLDRKSVV